jgi:putative SOS response-associated peptidase YedK
VGRSRGARRLNEEEHVCGRYLVNVEQRELEVGFSATQQIRIPIELPRFNVAPTQVMPVVVQDEDEHRLVAMRWGLVPSWSKRLDEGIINARAETAADKPSFRRPLRSRRCLVPASGFYEWAKTPQGRVPHLFRVPDQPLFAFAGLWDRWQGPQGDVDTYTILTCEANPLLARVHQRMPCILTPNDHAAWLDPQLDEPEALRALLQPYPAEGMEGYPVSTGVNIPTHDDPALLAPAGPALTPVAA